MAQLTDADVALWKTRKAEASEALHRLIIGGQEGSVSHGNDASNTSMTFIAPKVNQLRQEIERLTWEIENRREMTYSHKPVTICN